MDPRVPNPVASRTAAVARLLRAAREDVSSALFAVGFATCVTAVSAAFAAGAPAAHRALAGWAALGGLGAMCAAVWVAADAPRRRTAGQVILCAAFLPLVVAVGLSSGSDPVLDFNIIDAMA